MPPDFLIRAGFAGIGLALAAGPLGCFVVWRRMAYFSDATSHAALLGVALALASDLPVALGVTVTALSMALVLVALNDRGRTSDTLLGVMAHSALASGLVALSFLPGVRIDLMGYLFGDILAVNFDSLVGIWAGAAAVIGLMAWRWGGMVTATLNPDLAVASGLKPRREELVLTLALALVVASALKVVGALLIAAMLVIPAAAARQVTRTPEAMAITASVLGAASVMVGLWGSFRWDTPSGPSIVLAAAVFFLISVPLGRLRRS